MIIALSTILILSGLFAIFCEHSDREERHYYGCVGAGLIGAGVFLIVISL